MHDLIIIGAGPAGLAAGIYAGRFKLSTLLFERLSAGGQIILSPSIENYPGFPQGVSTFDLIDKFKKQVEDLGILIENKEVLEIIPAGNFFTIKTNDGEFKAKSVIIATGAKPKLLNVPGETEFIGRGVSYCGTCDGPLFKNKDIIVIGGGDRAVEDAIFLANYAKTVYLVHRRSGFRASQILVDKAKKNNKINLVLESVVTEIYGNAKVSGVKVQNVSTKNFSDIPCQGVFVFVGIIPNTELFKNLLEVDDSGFIITNTNLATSRGGVFAGGDCIRKSLYQVVSACSDGATAADSAHKYLLNL